jgi:hypothetical protein
MFSPGRPKVTCPNHIDVHEIHPTSKPTTAWPEIFPMDKLNYERADYSVVVKNRAPPKTWRWEIYRAGNANPIKQSPIRYDTTAAAGRAGKDALNELSEQPLHLMSAPGLPNHAQGPV